VQVEGSILLPLIGGWSVQQREKWVKELNQILEENSESEVSSKTILIFLLKRF